MVDTLRELADMRNVLIGSAVSADRLRDSERYRETLAREFNVLTVENAMKFEPLHPQPDTFDFIDADLIVDFAEANAMKVRGHTLVWHRRIPSWLRQADLNRDGALRVLREHIDTVVGRYRGQIFAWDVVNEAVNEDGSLRESFWLEEIGADYVEVAFQMAHEADPDALLFYNDYGGEGRGPKSDAIHTFVQELVERGVSLHGVGLQMHVSVGEHPTGADVAMNVARLGDLGLQVHVTEMDVQIQNGRGGRRQQLEAQAVVYREVADVCLRVDAATGLVVWGFSDRDSWIPAFTGRPDAACLFDEHYRAKPAYHAIAEILTASN